MDERERYEQGLSTRRAVLGDAHVDRALKTSNAFNREFQDLITRYACGELWTRPVLARRERSLVTLAIMFALGRDEWFRMHPRDSFRTCVTSS